MFYSLLQSLLEGVAKVLFSLDLHIHSKYSFDSLMSPKTILKIAERRGLNAVAITDHNTIAGGVKAYGTSKKEKTKVMVITGAEISTNIGDVVGLFLNKEIKSRSILEVIEEIRAQDGLVLIPHPFRSHEFDNLRAIIGQIDLVEKFNSRCPITLQQNHLLQTLNKTLVGGSDAHFPQEIGLCRTIINSSDLDIHEIKRMLRCPSNVRAYGSYGSSFFQTLSHIVKFIRSKPFLRVHFSNSKAYYSCTCIQNVK